MARVLSESQARRVGNVVRRVERMPFKTVRRHARPPRLMSPRNMLAVLNEDMVAATVDLQPAGPAEATLYSGPNDAPLTAGETVDVYCLPLRTGPLIAGTYVTVAWVNGAWFILNANC